MAVGTSVTVFGHEVTVTAVSSNGKRVQVAGCHYSGWTNASNVKAAS